ncbi:MULTISPECIES: response regulator transcription factor [Pseudidiomarina]|uniref:LuxR family two component transcriptional regulator n=2 Tax=Pseudidiomarina TaxID=2800384 RepID=A0A368UWZ4_9GAMM|nr:MULTISPECIES: response regulator transcription factor [Pseudidiomarina]MDX1525522.1 response regulator transcription factor [Pseudidiomarina maritima]PWW13317.1 LuxR family two component transcriptional regulator [Pseudidiomarina maritima]RBP90784.1 LuxR family two component transcriptional regulator [Pseudidiomarina tainanensis]RCW32580.1 LuxR family two component transcriptional regulator [Pseudidiomarina tainanensis]
MSDSLLVTDNLAMARAIIADDHPLFRAALTQALRDTLSDPILEAANFQQLLELLAKNPQIELVLLDLTMPGNRGLTGLVSLRHRYPEVLVVVVSANEQVTVMRQAMNYGASAYIPKSLPLVELQQAVQVVLAGETWLPEHLLAAVSADETDASADFAQRLEQLTPHQYRVLECLADGMLNKQIAYELNVQETTIKQHVSAILRKLNVINRTQAGVVFKQMLYSPDEQEH